jgi:hypothetical protein|tara:strand:- start:216 stop:422 length:207 start_codon:yes stop_codon:yes gene_type:complete
MLELLQEYYKNNVYVNFVLKSGNRTIDGCITRITWDDMDDVIHIIHPLTKEQSFFPLKMVESVSILKS